MSAGTLDPKQKLRSRQVEEEPGSLVFPWLCSYCASLGLYPFKGRDINFYPIWVTELSVFPQGRHTEDLTQCEGKLDAGLQGPGYQGCSNNHIITLVTQKAS